MPIQLPRQPQPPIVVSQDPAANFIQNKSLTVDPLFRLELSKSDTNQPFQYNNHGTEFFSYNEPSPSGLESASRGQPVHFSPDRLFKCAMTLWCSNTPDPHQIAPVQKQSRKNLTLKSKTDVDSTRRKFSIRGKENWQEVEETFQAARESYFDSTSTATHRRFWRSCIQDEASLQEMKSVLQLVPNCGMTALLVGGATMLVDVSADCCEAG